MARPKNPLLSRELITKAALKIIDERGLHALSLPALATDLGVSAPSLYHHFQDKAEILSDVARAIAHSAVVPKLTDHPDWVEWMVELSNNFRHAVLRHRNAAPVFIEHLPRDLIVGAYERSARLMHEAGVPSSLHVLILDGCDRLSLGSILIESGGGTSINRPHTYSGFDPEIHARLADAVSAYEASAERLFQDEIRAYIRGVVALENFDLEKVTRADGPTSLPRPKKNRVSRAANSSA